MTLTHIKVRHLDGREEDIYVAFGAAIGTVYPDGSVVTEILSDEWKCFQ